MRGRDWDTHRSSIIEDGFNGGRLRSYSWISRYLEYMETFWPAAMISRTEETPMEFTPLRHEERDSNDGASAHISVKGEFKQIRVRLIHGKTELLIRNCIFEEMDLAVNFRIG